ncbi:hypothetical protein [Streptomyces sp. NPDC001315]|uniref:hypothetical protein n=1 Tax=Streptomyces sp. NPDC001315 TaxID=3364562 RepID=UPI0036A031DB
MKGMAALAVPAVSAMPLAAASGCLSRTMSTTPTGGGACAFAWPPPLTSGTPKAAPFARSNLISTSKRSNGITQVTYTGHLLHCFTGATTAGDTNGEKTSASSATVVRRKRARQQGRTRLIGD